ncbi:MAG: FAD-binding oxidoreductase, partial [Rhabdochlamydiaceae bacterium]
RSGGHCLESASLSSGYIIDLRYFNSVKPDTKRQEVYIGAGCRLGTVIKTLGKIGYAIPTGTCSSVGVTGLSLGGGLGVLGRVFGPTCDSIKSITLLTAEGEIIEVTEKSHSDLFWALRGAGNGSYGIVLGLKFKMHYVPKVSTLNLSWKWESKTVHAVTRAWQAWVKTLPQNITTQLDFKYLNKQLSLTVTGLKVGTKPFREWKKAFSHLHPTVQVKKLSYLKSAFVWADRAPYPFFKGKSEILFKPLSDEPIDTAISFFEELKKQNESYYAFFELEAMGGAFTKGKSAFFPRKAFAWWYQVMYWDKEEMAERAFSKLRQFKEDIAPYVSPYSYANILDYDIGKDYLQVYYGDHVDRLIQVKKRYDPDNLFHWHQSIPLKK